MERLNRPAKTSELRVMCLQVVVASVYHDLALTQSVVPEMNAFIKQWLTDTDCFLGLHDRKICVLGLCTMLHSPNKPTALQECSKEILPSLILLFDGLKRAYAAKALENAETDSEEVEEEEDDDVEEALSSDEDDIDEDGVEYLEQLDVKLKKASAPFPMSTEDDDDYEDEDDDDEDNEETPLECFGTPLDEEDCVVDEYVVFKEVIVALQQHDPSYYNLLTSSLNKEQVKSLQEIFTLADQRRAAKESKEIQKRGGFEFRAQTVPSTFNFGGGNSVQFGR